MGRVPDCDVIFSRWCECVTDNSEVADASDKVDAPALQSFGIRDEGIVLDGNVRQCARMHAGIDSRRHCAIGQTWLGADDAVPKSNVRHLRRPGVQPQAFTRIAQIQIVVHDVTLLMIINVHIA